MTVLQDIGYANVELAASEAFSQLILFTHYYVPISHN